MLKNKVVLKVMKVKAKIMTTLIKIHKKNQIWKKTPKRMKNIIVTIP